jgi:hypothetical protein
VENKRDYAACLENAANFLVGSIYIYIYIYIHFFYICVYIHTYIKEISRGGLLHVSAYANAGV